MSIELFTSDASVRIRQVAVLGHYRGGGAGDNNVVVVAHHRRLNSNNLKTSPSWLVSQFSTVQLDAFRLLQNLVAYAFDVESSTAAATVAGSMADSFHLRQHVLQIVFDQKFQSNAVKDYVRNQLQLSLEREIQLVSNGSKQNYSYLYVLLTVIQNVFARGNNNASSVIGLKTLCQTMLRCLSHFLLRCRPLVLQQKVIETLSNLVELYVVDNGGGVSKLEGVTATSSKPNCSEIERILDYWLIAIAKSINVQLKDRAAATTTAAMHHQRRVAPLHSIHLKDYRLEFADWSVDCELSLKNTHLLIALLVKLASSTTGAGVEVGDPSNSSVLVDNVRNVIATHILSINGIEQRSPEYCITSKRFWLALSSLAVLRNADWLSSSPLWVDPASKKKTTATSSSPPQRDVAAATTPMCDNHDNGVTLAYARCRQCEQNLCRECLSVMHLNRKRRQHLFEVLLQPAHQQQHQSPSSSSALSWQQQHQPIHVTFNEGCSRLKTQWLRALIDVQSLHALLDFQDQFDQLQRHQQQQLLIDQNPDYHNHIDFNLIDGDDNNSDRFNFEDSKCKFCGKLCPDEMMSSVCSSSQCQQLAANGCIKLLAGCGHKCGGVAGESRCLPCLRCRTDASLRQDAEDMCMICFTYTLAQAPSIQLRCGHVYHFACVRAILAAGYAGPRINFGYLQCPICKALIEPFQEEEEGGDDNLLRALLEPQRLLYDDVCKKALIRLEYEGLSRCKEIVSPAYAFYNDPLGYALNKYSYYLCYKCRRAYFGGEARCNDGGGGGQDGDVAAAAAGVEFDPSELLCGACSDVAQAQICAKHGVDYLEYKCRYCCSIAIFFCFGTTHFCAGCHDDFQRLIQTPRQMLPPCPAGPKLTRLTPPPSTYAAVAAGSSSDASAGSGGGAGGCPLKVKHPPTGDEFALGCGICRNVQSF